MYIQIMTIAQHRIHEHNNNNTQSISRSHVNWFIFLASLLKKVHYFEYGCKDDYKCLLVKVKMFLLLRIQDSTLNKN